MFDFKCPECQSDIITCEAEEIYPEEMCCVYECHDCDAEWRVLFTITPKEIIRD